MTRKKILWIAIAFVLYVAATQVEHGPMERPLAYAAGIAVGFAYWSVNAKTTDSK